MDPQMTQYSHNNCPFCIILIKLHIIIIIVQNQNLLINIVNSFDQTIDNNDILNIDSHIVCVKV